MSTSHTVLWRDARDLSPLEDSSVDLVVTSPPYPMIEMWDDVFAALDPSIENTLRKGDGGGSFELMHRVLDEVWRQLYRVMKDGALACINIGDATRTIKERFSLLPNHARIQTRMAELGFTILPAILWRKQTNAPNKFMGSGMLPPGAYVTLEHEYILIFRKGGKRKFTRPEEKERRMESAYFWEERNRWFSDIWDFKGVRQYQGEERLRERSAAYPFILPFRLINMFSIYGDTVLDPFLGSGTTALAAAVSGRNSAGCEIEKGFAGAFRSRMMQGIIHRGVCQEERLSNHMEFVQKYQAEKGPMKYTNQRYGFPVMTRQETGLKLAVPREVRSLNPDSYIVSYGEGKRA